MRYTLLITFFTFFISCSSTNQKKQLTSKNANFISVEESNQVSLVVLGTLQDAGSPHIACKKDCCKTLFENPDKNRKVVCLGVVDNESQKSYLFEATPDMPKQMKLLKRYANFNDKETPDGIFLTHAHIGHYSGLMYLGKEAMNASSVPVYAMPRMKNYLEQNGPWSQLVNTDNIVIKQMNNDVVEELTSNVKVVPFTVPHRDEYSETVGYKIIGPNKTALFIPDIDKWGKWEKDIINEINSVDYAFIDATFFDGDEINNRDISEIPHPFIIESMSLLNNLTMNERGKIYFIHFNHTNPTLNPESEAVQQILNNGYNIAKMNDIVTL